MCRLVPYLPTRSDVIGNCWYNPPPDQTTWATKSNLTAYHCLPILNVSRHMVMIGRRQKWLSIELERYAEVLALFEHTYFCIDARGRGWWRCFGRPPSCRSTQLAENSCSFEAACTFSWPHFVLRGCWDRGGISCITVALSLCVFLWFHLYSLHYRGPSVWLGTTHSLTCQITSV